MSAPASAPPRIPGRPRFARGLPRADGRRVDTHGRASIPFAAASPAPAHVRRWTRSVRASRSNVSKCPRALPCSTGKCPARVEHSRGVDRSSRDRQARRGSARSHAAHHELQHARRRRHVARRAASASSLDAGTSRLDPVSDQLLPRRLGLLPRAPGARVAAARPVSGAHRQHARAGHADLRRVLRAGRGRAGSADFHAHLPSSLCNDNLTGIAIATELAAQLRRLSPHFSYRFVFGPGTIGSITWLARNEQRVDRVRHGLVLGLVGDRGPLTYKRSRQGGAEIDRIGAFVLKQIAPEARVIDFSPYGYDERQLCSPGFNLPVGRLTRTPNSEYPEYHSSADNFSILERDSLAQSLFAATSMLRIADRNASYLNLSPKCEPRLGKRGLFRNTGGRHPGEFEHALLWVLNQSDGSHSLLDITGEIAVAVRRGGGRGRCPRGCRAATPGRRGSGRKHAS